MKKQPIWLVLPLVFVVFLLGFQWRSDNPATTEEDARIRALVEPLQVAFVAYQPPLHKRYFGGQTMISQENFAPFVNSLHVIEKPTQQSLFAAGAQGLFEIKCVNNGQNLIYVTIAVGENEDSTGTLFVLDDNNAPLRALHPATTKRWVSLLKSNISFRSAFQEA